MIKIDATIRTEIAQEIAEFANELRESGLQHSSTEMFAEVVRDYASWVIALSLSDFTDGQTKPVANTVVEGD